MRYSCSRASTRRPSERFAEIQAASADERAQLWAKLEPELKVHEEMEEAALYGPVASEVGSKDETLKEWQGPASR